jgi:hypothetical protein
MNFIHPFLMAANAGSLRKKNNNKASKQATN